MSENFSEKSQLEDVEEIEFDDNIDIDALQQQLQQHMADENIDYTPEPQKTDETVEITQFNTENSLVPQENDQNDTLELDNFVKSVESGVTQATTDNNDTFQTELFENKNDNNNTEQKPKDEKLKLQIGEKKYIIYIEPDNIDFLDALTIKERKSVINRLIHDEDVTVKKRKQFEDRAKFINQVIIMVLTVVISLPIFFVLLNKSIEVTILNYQQSQQNFVKLYKEQGKIKSYKKFQNKF